MIRLLLLLSILFFYQPLFSQDPNRFSPELMRFDSLDRIIKKEESSIEIENLFVGSSSIRFWLTLQQDYPDKEILNRGFGGSHMSDLLYHVDKLILQYHPKKIFIYEGDNDISASESVDDIMAETKELIGLINKELPTTEIYLIAAKPSIARWSFVNEYIKLNRAFIKLSLLDPQIHYVDVWTPMLGDDGVVLQDIFIADDLHMTDKGYDIWAEAIRPFLYEE